MDIEVYETEIPLDGNMTVEEYRKKKDQEKAYDAELDKLADELSIKLMEKNKESSTLAYWEIGKLINEFVCKASSDVNQKKEPYEYFNKAYDRLIEKINKRLENKPDLDRNSYSVPYMKKWVRLSKLFSRAQAERPVPYPLAHELLYDELDANDVDFFLDRCEDGKFDNTTLRKAVEDYLEKKNYRRKENPNVDRSEKK